MTDPDYTSADLDALTDLETQEGHRLVFGRVRAELERRRLELERPGDENYTAELRGRIVALRMVLAIPTILKEEITAQLKEQSHGR